MQGAVSQARAPSFQFAAGRPMVVVRPRFRHRGFYVAPHCVGRKFAAAIGFASEGDLATAQKASEAAARRK